MTFRESYGGGNSFFRSYWIAAEGVITPQTADDFFKYLSRNGPPQSPKPGEARGTIILNSTGGDLEGGLRLGLLFRKYGLNTVVGHTIPKTSESTYDRKEAGLCASSCAYAFLGGLTRKVLPGSYYGLHEFSITNQIDTVKGRIVAANAQITVGTLLQYAMEMGADPLLIYVASSTPSNSITWLNSNRLAELNVDTATPAPSTWTLGVSADGYSLYAEANQRQRDTDIIVQMAVACDVRRSGNLLLSIVSPTADDQERFTSVRGALEGVAFIFDNDYNKTMRVDLITFEMFEAGKLLTIVEFSPDVMINTVHSSQLFNVDFGLPHVFWGDILPTDQSAFDVPLANLGTIAPVLMKNCGTHSLHEPLNRE
jgi:hypothetical protein